MSYQFVGLHGNPFHFTKGRISRIVYDSPQTLWNMELRTQAKLKLWKNNTRTHLDVGWQSVLDGLNSCFNLSIVGNVQLYSNQATGGFAFGIQFFDSVATFVFHEATSKHEETEFVQMLCQGEAETCVTTGDQDSFRVRFHLRINIIEPISRRK